MPTCLVHNCETSRGLLDFHLLSPLFQDQIPFDPHQRYPNSHNSASCGTVDPQYYLVLFLNISHELLFHFSCCAFPFIGHAASSSSTLLSFLFCAFPLSKRAGSLLSPWCTFSSTGCTILLIFFHDGVTPQVNFLQKITFDTLYNNGFLIRVCSRTLSISSERTTI